MVITHYKPLIKSFQSKVELLFGGLSEEEFTFKPSKRKWSVQQCIQHLNASGNLYAQQVARAIDTGNHKGNNGCSYRKLPRFMIWVVKPPYHVRLIAPKSFKPPPYKQQATESKQKTIQTFSELQTRLYNQVCTVHKHCLEGAVVSSPLTRLIRLNLCELFGLVCAHEKRHIWQAEKMIQSRRQ